jgi:hypothetical protein
MLRVAVGADRCDEFDTSGIEVGGSGSGSPEDIVLHSRRAIAAWIANGLEGYVKRGELHLGAATALKLLLPRCPWIAAVAHGRRFLQNSSILSSKRPLDRASLLKWSTRAELDLVPASEVETWKRRRIVDDARLQTTLLYRASEDGWEADDFHCHCDRQGPTMTIIRTTGKILITASNYIFHSIDDNILHNYNVRNLMNIFSHNNNRWTHLWRLRRSKLAQ